MNAEQIFQDWEANYMPKDLAKDNFNALLIADEIKTAFNGVVSITNLNACVSRLGDKLHRTVTVVAPPAAEPFVLKTPEGVPITSKDELTAYINKDARNMRRLIYDNRGKRSVEAEKEVNRLLNSTGTVNEEKRERNRRRVEADRMGIKRFGSDTTELDRKTPAKIVEDTTFNKNVAAANQNAARIALDSVIDQQLVNSPSGRVNHTATHQLKERLRGVKVIDTKTLSVDYVATLQAVTAEIKKLR